METTQAAIGAIMVFGFPLMCVVGLWKVFEKTNWIPAWTSLVPLYNIAKLAIVSGVYFPEWYYLAVPLWPFLIWWPIARGLARQFGKGTGFAVGLWCAPFICLPILGFGKDKYSLPGTEEKGDASVGQ